MMNDFSVATEVDHTTLSPYILQGAFDFRIRTQMESFSSQKADYVVGVTSNTYSMKT